MICKSCGSNIDEGENYCPACGTEVENRTAPLAPGDLKGSGSSSRIGAQKPETRFLNNGRYKLLDKIGAGGMGMVHLALDVKMDARVVVKEMLPPRSDESGASDYFQKQFINEAKLLYKLSHRGIPKVTDFFTENARYYLVMEQIAGQNLSDLVKGRNPSRISVSEFYQLMSQILEILIYLHEHTPPIIHRDIKPANIMIKENGDLVLVDFGLAKHLETLSMTQTQVGTLGYASPEHYTGKFCIQSDIYCLGASFHYLLSGDPPNTRIPFDFPPLTKYRSDIPLPVSGFINKMLQKEKEKRFRTAREALDQLRSVFGMIQEGFETSAISAIGENTQPVSFTEINKSNLAPSRIDLSEKNTSGINTVDDLDEYDLAPQKEGKSSVFPFAAALLAIILGGVGFFGYNHIKTQQERESVQSIPNVPAIVATHTQPEAEKSPAEEKQNADYLLEQSLKSARNGDMDKAVHILDKAIKINPDNSRLNMERGKMLKILGQNEKALADFEKVLSSLPNNTDALAARADINLKNGNTGKALEDINKLLTLKPDDTKMLTVRASVYYNIGENDKALGDLLRVLKNEPDNIKTQENALKLARNIRKQAFERKDYKKTLDLCNLILKYDSGNASEYINRALIYNALGMKDRAKIDMETVLKLDPDNKTAKSFLSAESTEKHAAIPVIRPTNSIPRGKPSASNGADITKLPETESTPTVDKPAKPDSGALHREFEEMDRMMPPPPEPPSNARQYDIDRYNYFSNLEQMMRNREYSKILSSIDSEIKTTPNEASLYFYRGRVLLMMDRYGEAEECFTRVKGMAKGGQLVKFSDWFLEKMKKAGVI